MNSQNKRKRKFPKQDSQKQEKEKKLCLIGFGRQPLMSNTNAPGGPDKHIQKNY